MNLLLSRSQNPSRTRIAVKGYQNQWGQAFVALKCIEDLAGDLQDFEITLFSCNQVTLKAAKRLEAKTGLKVTAFGKGALKNDQVHQLLSESIVLVSLSKSDGVPASMLEAMANGAVPIQSDTSAAGSAPVVKKEGEHSQTHLKSAGFTSRAVIGAVISCSPSGVNRLRSHG
jgi:glycosyltransferase involved in cell wall biosynthesis